MREILGVEPGETGAQWIAVRPEHIEVSREQPHNATLREIRFFGFYTTLVFAIKEDMSISAKVLAREDYVLGEQYRLRLRNREHARGLSSRPESAKSENS